LLTPELSLCGYPPRDLLLDPSFVTGLETTLQDLASQLPANIVVFVGTVTPNDRAAKTGGKPLFNSTVMLQNLAVRSRFHKSLLPTYDVFDEDRYFEPNDESNAIALSIGNKTIKIGVTICEDLWNDEEFWGKRTYATNPIDELGRSQVDIFVNLSASPYSLNKQSVREEMLRHTARRYQTPIVYVNQVGGNDDLIFDGNSVAFNRSGELIYRAKHCQSDLGVIEFDRDRGDIVPGEIAPFPNNEEAQLWEALVLGVRDYANKCNFSQIVLGLSGGIDSALVAAIAAEAIGADNVLGVLMPSPYSSQGSIDDAMALAKNLGIQTRTIAIEAMMKSFDDSLAELFVGKKPGVAEENLQARIRGNLLMAISNKFGHLLLSTGNKSEMAVGYCTLYGDMDGGLAAIADVPKTRVFKLCRWLNQRQPGRDVIPQNIINKPPSAELKPGQQDSDSLPAYEILDDILDRFIHQHESGEQVIAAGHDRAIVQKVIKMVRRAEFKRKQAAPVLKVTDRAFGTGWRMPIAANYQV